MIPKPKIGRFRTWAVGAYVDQMVPTSRLFNVLFAVLGIAMFTAFLCGILALDATLEWFGGQLLVPFQLGLGVQQLLAGPTAAVLASTILVGVLTVPWAIRRRELAAAGHLRPGSARGRVSGPKGQSAARDTQPF